MRTLQGLLVGGVAVVVLALVPAAAGAQAFDVVTPQTRLTQIGPDGDTSFLVDTPSVAYNSLQDEFLAVWSGVDPVAPGENEIYGRILDGAGNPKGPVRRLTNVPGTDDALQPVVGYSPTVNQYLLAYTAPPPPPDPEGDDPAGQREVLAQVVSATGLPSGDPARISVTHPPDVDPPTPDTATDPSLAYDPERDQYRLVWRADVTTDADFEIHSRRVSSSLANPDGLAQITISSNPTGDADEPSIAYLPAQDRYAIAWQGPTPASGTQVFAEVISFGGGVIGTSDVQISQPATGSALRPSIAANPTANEALVAFVREAAPGENEVYVQRFAAAGAQSQLPNATDTRISTMGPDGNVAYDVDTLSTTNTTTTYHPGLDRYLVTWRADHDLPGLVDGEFERYGQALDGAGNEVAADDFRISAMGADGNTASAPERGAVAASTARRAWLHVWDADDNRPPLANGEFELYGRLIGDDRDFDGSVPPADCDDSNAGIRPGAADVPDNGVDEDCSGADAVNLDRDADGSPRPSDCDDGNPFVRPGVVDVPGNGIDEDCSGADAAVVRPLTVTTARVARDFAVFSRFTRVRVLTVRGAKRDMRIELRCRGSSCPRALHRNRVRRVTVRRAGTVSFTRTFRGARLRPKVVIEVRVTETGAIGRIDRFTIRNRKLPSHTQRCLMPGARREQRCPPT
jgi:hypothetical protein